MSGSYKLVTVKELAALSGMTEEEVLEVLECNWTVELLAAAAGVTTGYVRRLLGAGNIRGLRPGRDWLIHRNSGDVWLNGKGVKIVVD